MRLCVRLFGKARPVSLQEQLVTVLAQPAPAALWQLRAELLEAGLPPEAPALAILGEFYHFLNRLATTSTSHQYSHFASILDMGAVGGVAIQNLLEARRGSEWWQRLLAGGVSETLMVLAARQYVKAWEGEMEASYTGAAWFLYDAYWRMSTILQPDLPAGARRQLLDRLLDPLHQAGVKGVVKAALIGRLFQMLLVAHLFLKA